MQEPENRKGLLNVIFQGEDMVIANENLKKLWISALCLGNHGSSKSQLWMQEEPRIPATNC